MNTVDLTAALRAAPVLRELPDVELGALARLSRVKSLGAREPLWRAGELASHVGVVVAGRLKLVRHRRRSEVIVEVLGPSDLAGSAAFSLRRCHLFDVVCLRRAAVLLVPGPPLRAMVDRSARASAALAAELGAQVLRLTARLESVAARSVEQRLAWVMLSLMARFGERIGGGEVLVPVQLRREELASLAATTLESASRRLSQWRRAGILQPQPAGFLVRDVAALHRIAAGEPELEPDPAGAAH